MSKIIEQGGPAFPMHDALDIPVGSVSEYNRLMTGMTLRDYFAAKALAGLIAEPVSEMYTATTVHCTPNHDGSRDWAPGERLATAAYVLADAMLRAREA